MVAGLIVLRLLLWSPSVEDPRGVVQAAASAIEADSATRLHARWSARLARDPTDRAARLGLATLARLSYQYDSAQRLYLPLLRPTGSPADTLAVYGRLGLALTARGRGSNAVADSLFGLAIAEARQAGDRLAEAEGLLYRATTQMRIAGLAASLALVDRSRALIADSDAAYLATWHCTRALVLGASNRAEAGPEARTGAQLARRASDARQQAACLAILGRDLAREGKVDSAVAVVAGVAAEFARIHDWGDLAAVSQWRGYMLVGQGLYGEARRDLDTAVRQGRASENLSAVAWSLLSLSIISVLEGDPTTGWTQVEVAESLFASQGDQWGLAALKGTQGAVARALGDRASARAAFAQALAQSTTLNPDGVIQSRINLALLAADERDWPGAERELMAARATVRSQGMKGWDQALEYYFGAVALERGDLATAERSLRLDLKTLKPDQQGRRYPAESKLAEVYARQGKLDRAEVVLAGATDSLETWRASLDDQGLRLHVFDLREGDFNPNRSVDAVIGALARSGRAEAAFDLAERRRARELLDRLVRFDVLRGASGATIDRKLTRPTAEVVAHALPDDHTAFVEFTGGRSDRATTLFVITRAGLQVYPLAEQDSVDQQVVRMEALLQAGASAGDLGKRLGASLLGPALADLPASIWRLVIVPDGSLYALPFEALVLPDGRAVVERYSVTQSPSAAVSLELWGRAHLPRPVRLLAFGDPKFGGEVAPGSEAQVYRSAFDQSGGLTRLARSAEEVRAVARYAPEASIRLREDASEAFLRRTDLRPFGVLHFATHAVVDERAVTRTALALAPGDGEDGFVGPADLAALDLEADMVVLSACRTASGVVIGGEGIQGLTAPLLSAGARAVVATEWPIGDRSTLDLVDQFYRGLAEGLPVGDALHAAKLAAWRRGAPTRDWAAFTLVGDPLVRISLRRPPGTRWWWAAVAISAAACYGLLRWKRRGVERN